MFRFIKKIFSSEKSPRFQGDIAVNQYSSSVERTTSIDTRRAILDWRDQFTEEAELQFRTELSQLLNTLDKVMQNASVRELLGKKYAKEYLDPLCLEWQEREVGRFLQRLESAQKSLLITEIKFSQREMAVLDDASSGSALSLLLPTAATGIGVAALPSAGAASLVSAGGVLGFFGVTTISWPILLSGLAVSAALISTGVVNGAKVKDKLREKIRNRVEEHMTLQVLGDGSGTSLVENIQKYIEDVASDALARL